MLCGVWAGSPYQAGEPSGCAGLTINDTDSANEFIHTDDGTNSRPSQVTERVDAVSKTDVELFAPLP